MPYFSDRLSILGGIPAVGTNMTFLNAPVLEMQLLGAWMTPGSASGGVAFIADVSNVVTVGNTTTFDFHLFANELIQATEDPNAIGFAGWTLEWHQQGSGVYTAPVPIPAAVWMFGSGLLGLMGLGGVKPNENSNLKLMYKFLKYKENYKK